MICGQPRVSAAEPKAEEMIKLPVRSGHTAHGRMQ